MERRVRLLISSVESGFLVFEEILTPKSTLEDTDLVYWI